MAGIRKRTWKNKSGIHSCYEINFVFNGQQFRKSGYSSKLEAQLDMKNIVTNADNIDIAFGVIASEYLNKHCALNCKTSTKDLYANYLKVNLQDFKLKIAQDITKRDIESLVLNLKNKGLTNKTINGIVTFIQAILNYGVDNGLLKTNPVPKFKKLPQVKPEIKFMNEEQIDLFIKLAKETPLYEFFVTAVKTGMRRGELIALEWPDIDFKRNIITVNKQIYRGITQTTKTGKERYVDICQSLREILLQYKKENNIFSRYVFHNKFGDAIHPYNMEERYFHPLIKKCNSILSADNQIVKLRFHDLRHTYATYLLSKGVPVKYVQEQLGHSTARMTLDTYAKFMPSVKFGALDLLDNMQIEHDLNTGNENSIITRRSVRGA